MSISGTRRAEICIAEHSPLSMREKSDYVTTYCRKKYIEEERRVTFVTLQRGFELNSMIANEKKMYSFFDCLCIHLLRLHI